jgi:hypothetical protein
MREEEMVIALAGIAGLRAALLACAIWMVLHYLFAAFRTARDGLKGHDLPRLHGPEIVEVVGRPP